MKLTKGYDYDDILIIPRRSVIESRDDVSVATPISNIPIFSAPMKGISGPELVKKLGELGGIGILHRFYSLEERLNHIDNLGKEDINFGVAIGVNNAESEIRVADRAMENGASVLCIDIANGYLNKIETLLRFVRRKYSKIYIMCGNVVTGEGAKFLRDCGVDLIRVGIGGGLLCSTRNVTGIGMPQLTAIEDCYRKVKTGLVSDGGVRNSGNAVKSFAMGAEFVMLGSMLAYANEAENNGRIMGMASRKIQEEYSSSVKSVEGLEMELDSDKRPLADIIYEFVYGIKSACTYLGCNNYNQIKNRSKFVSTGNGTLKNV